MPSCSIIAVVQLPPPVNGLSTANAAMTARFAERNLLAGIANIGPPPGRPRWQQLTLRVLRTFGAVGTLARARIWGANVLYMPPDASRGLALNILLVVVARVFGYQICFHHHNFSYLDSYSAAFDRLIAWSPKGALHLLLCERMEQAMRATYPRACAAKAPVTMVLPNAHLVAPGSCAASPRGPLTIGHLSNLTVEKGVLRFLDLFARLRAENIDVRAVVAGPALDPAVRATIEGAMAAHGDRLRWLGPVYGTAKERFYRDIEVFVFPSSYVNEAQPLVLLEALAHGAAVLAIDRGCIGCDHPDTPGGTYPDEAFDDAAVKWLSALAASPERRCVLPQACIEAFRTAQRQADARLAAVLELFGSL